MVAVTEFENPNHCLFFVYGVEKQATIDNHHADREILEVILGSKRVAMWQLVEIENLLDRLFPPPHSVERSGLIVGNVVEVATKDQYKELH